jgi:putative transposase
MKTIEFKLDLTQKQAATIDQWLSALKPIWNYGLSLYEERQQRKWRDKLDADLPRGLVLKWKKGKIVGTGILKTRDGHPYCPIRTQSHHEDIKEAIGDAYRFHDQDWILAVCSRARIALIQHSLDPAWKAYQKGIRKRPRYKGRNDKILSLANYGGVDLKKTVKFSGNKIKLPKLGWIKVKGLSERWDIQWHLSNYRIVKQPSGYYLQLVGDLPPTDYGTPSDKAVGVDVGSTKVWTDTLGRQVEPKRYARKKQKQLARLQRKVSRQQKGSKNQAKTRQRIAKVHEKIARQRKGFNHQLSTKIVKEYGAVAVEDINLQNLTRKPKAKLREDGKGYKQNGAKRKAGLHKSLLDHGIGQLRTMIETKAKCSDREFVKVKAAYTSQECAVCGHTSAENRPKKPMTKFLCVACGHADHADRNAAINILNRGLMVFDRQYRIYPSLVGKITPERGETLESSGDVPLGDAEAVSGRQMKQEATHNSTLAQVRPAISPQKGARHDSDLTEKVNKTDPTVSGARDRATKRKRLKRAYPENQTQLTIWDLTAS